MEYDHEMDGETGTKGGCVLWLKFEREQTYVVGFMKVEGARGHDKTAILTSSVLFSLLCGLKNINKT